MRKAADVVRLPYYNDFSECRLLISDGTLYGHREWNPLRNTDDAFELRQKFHCMVIVNINDRYVRVEPLLGSENEKVIIENLGYDIEAAVRKAIVRYAAGHQC